jgi:hypothetical protein
MGLPFITGEDRVQKRLAKRLRSAAVVATEGWEMIRERKQSNGVNSMSLPFTIGV